MDINVGMYVCFYPAKLCTNPKRVQLEAQICACTIGRAEAAMLDNHGSEYGIRIELATDRQG